MKPLDALFELIHRASLYTYDPKKPGLVVMKAPQHIREALQSLTSDDTQNIRLPEKIIVDN